MATFSPVGKVCSFCGLTGTQSTLFAGGLGALMCYDCVERYHEILRSSQRLRSLRRPWWQDMTEEELLETLPKIVATAEQVDDFLREWVDVLRDRKVSWSAIGAALGVTRQAVWDRFAKTSAGSNSDGEQNGRKKGIASPAVPQRTPRQ